MQNYPFTLHVRLNAYCKMGCQQHPSFYFYLQHNKIIYLPNKIIYINNFSLLSYFSISSLSLSLSLQQTNSNHHPTSLLHHQTPITNHRSQPPPKHQTTTNPATQTPYQHRFNQGRK